MIHKAFPLGAQNICLQKEEAEASALVKQALGRNILARIQPIQSPRLQLRFHMFGFLIKQPEC